MDGSGFMVLHEFSGGPADGWKPWSGLSISGGMIYGSTIYGGPRIDSATGELIFFTAPDFEIPTASNLDNIYVVVIQVSVGGFTLAKNISVQVMDVSDL